MGAYLPHLEGGSACFTFLLDLSFFENLSYGLVVHKLASPILSKFRVCENNNLSCS